MAFIPPTEALNDSPTVCVQINKQWVSHVMGRVQALIQDWYWSGDDETIYDATQEGEKLMLALALGNEACSEVSMAPIGSIVIWPSDEIPENYLLCDGSFISISEYPELVAVIGTIYGEGVDTVALPNLTERFPLGVSGSHAIASTGGAETHTLTEAEMPDHTHTIADHSHSIPGHTHSTPDHTHTTADHSHSTPALSHAITPAASQTIRPDINVRTNGAVGSGARVLAADASTGGFTTQEHDEISVGPFTPVIANHAANTTGSGGAGTTGSGGAGTTGSGGGGTTGSAGTGTSSAGGGEAHNNMPPYLTLNYIIRAN